MPGYGQQQLIVTRLIVCSKNLLLLGQCGKTTGDGKTLQKLQKLHELGPMTFQSSQHEIS